MRALSRASSFPCCPLMEATTSHHYQIDVADGFKNFRLTFTDVGETGHTGTNGMTLADPPAGTVVSIE